MRKIIALKDEQYNITIARNNLFAPIVEAFKANKRRYNLLNSALIELFEYIRQEDMRTLSNYFVENFYSDFESISYVRTFRELKLRYDAHRDKRERISSDGSVPCSLPAPFSSCCSSSPTSSTTRFHDNRFLSFDRLRKDERDLDVDEENWFNEDTDENRIGSLNHGTLFTNNSDDDDSQPEMASAISTSEPKGKSRHSDDDEEDEQGLLTSTCSSKYSKPVISIHIGHSTSSEGQASESSSSPYAMVRR